MQEHTKSFEDVEAELLDRMKSRGCTPVTVTGYRYLCNSVITWLRNNGYTGYNKQGGEQYLRNYLESHGRNQYYSSLRTVICRLDDIIHNTWKDVHSDKGKKFLLSDEYNTVVNKYCDWKKIWDLHPEQSKQSDMQSLGFWMNCAYLNAVQLISYHQVKLQWYVQRLQIIIFGVK